MRSAARKPALCWARAFLLPQEPGGADKFNDSGEISAWARGYVGALSSRGYVQGAYGSFHPRASLTRAQAVTILDNIIKGFYYQGGEYTGGVDGSVVVNTGGVTLRDMEIDGDLILTEGVAPGSVPLDGVTVTGRVIVRGGSAALDGGRLDTVIIAGTDGGAVAIEMAGGASVDSLEIQSGALEVTGGTVSSVTVTGEGASVTVGGGCRVGSLTVGETGAGAEIALEGGAVGTLTLDGAAQVDNGGRIDRMEVNADGVILDGRKPGRQVVDPSVTQRPVDSDGSPVSGGSSGGSSSGGGSSGGGGGSVTPTAQEITSADAVSYTLNGDLHLVTAQDFISWYMSNEGTSKNVTVHTASGQQATAAIAYLALADENSWTGAADSSATFTATLTLPEGYVQPAGDPITATLTVTINAAQTKILTISSVAPDTEDPTAALTVTLSEAVAGLQASNFTVTGTGSATVDSVSTSDSGNTYTLALSNVVAGEAQVNLTGMDGYTYRAEGSQAAVTLAATPVTEVTVSVAVQNPNNIPTTTLKVTLSEAVAGLQASNFTVTGTGLATMDSVSTSDSGNTYTLNLSGVTAGEASVGLQNLPKGYKMAETGNSPTVTLRQAATTITNITQTAVNGGVEAASGRQLQFAISPSQITGTVEAGVGLNTAFPGVSFSTTYPTFEWYYRGSGLLNPPEHNGQYLLVAELEDGKITGFGQVKIEGVPQRIKQAAFDSNGNFEGVSGMAGFSSQYYVVLSAAPTSAELNQITTSSTYQDVQKIFEEKRVAGWTSFTETEGFGKSMLGADGKCLFLVWFSNSGVAVYAYATK